MSPRVGDKRPVSRDFDFRGPFFEEKYIRVVSQESLAPLMFAPLATVPVKNVCALIN